MSSLGFIIFIIIVLIFFGFSPTSLVIVAIAYFAIPYAEKQLGVNQPASK